MIRSFKCKDTEALFAGARCHRRWLSFRAVAERKLQMVQRAVRLEDLRIPPQNRLEAAKDVISDFVAERSYDQIGLVVFASNAFNLYLH